MLPAHPASSHLLASAQATLPLPAPTDSSPPLRSTRTCLLPPTPPARVRQGSGTPGVHTCHSERALTLLPQLQRKMEERRLRLQEAANKCVPASRPGTSGGGGSRWGLPRLPSSPEVPRPVLPSRRFCSQVALTPEEREQRALYAAILEYEQDHVSAGRGGVGRSGPRQAASVREEGLPGSLPRAPVLQDWPKHWKAKLKRSPGDLALVTSLVSHLLRYRASAPSSRD